MKSILLKLRHADINDDSACVARYAGKLNFTRYGTDG